MTKSQKEIGNPISRAWHFIHVILSTARGSSILILILQMRTQMLTKVSGKYKKSQNLDQTCPVLAAS